MDKPNRKNHKEPDTSKFRHDVRNILTVMSVNVQLLKRKLKDSNDPALVRYLQKIEQGMTTITTMVNTFRGS